MSEMRDTARYMIDEYSRDDASSTVARERAMLTASICALLYVGDEIARLRASYEEREAARAVAERFGPVGVSEQGR